MKHIKLLLLSILLMFNVQAQYFQQYTVIVAKTPFYDKPIEATKPRKAYLVQGEKINALKGQDGFIYTEFTNKQGQVTKGWINIIDLIDDSTLRLYKQPKNIQHFSSDLQIDELRSSITREVFNIEFNNATGVITLTDNRGSAPDRFSVAYSKTIKDKDGTIHWYKVLTGTNNFNIFKIRHFSKPQVYYGRAYNTILIFSLYRSNRRISDFGFLCNEQ